MGRMRLKSPALHLLLNRLFGVDQRKHQSSASLAFVWGIHRGPVNSPHKGPVTRKMFPLDDVIMESDDKTSLSYDITVSLHERHDVSNQHQLYGFSTAC